MGTIYTFRNEEHQGPYTVEQVQAQFESGGPSPADFVWCQGLPQWVPIEHLRQHGVTDLDRLLVEMKLPVAALVRIALANYVSIRNAAEQWLYSRQKMVTTQNKRAGQSHNLNGEDGMLCWRRKVLNPIGWRIFNGRRLKAGDRLTNGIALTEEDLAAYRTQAGAFIEAVRLRPNLKQINLFSDGTWVLVGFMERGSEPGMTVPRDFSEHGKRLAGAAHSKKDEPVNNDEFMELLNDQANFDYVLAFFAERKADFIKELSPFESLYRELAEGISSGLHHVPERVEDLIDVLNRTAASGLDRQRIQNRVLEEMHAQLNFFDRRARNNQAKEAADLRRSHLQKPNSFDWAWSDDIGNSFFYNYGMLDETEMRMLANDLTNFDLTRLDVALHNLEDNVQEGLEPLTSLDTPAAQATFMREARRRFLVGDDYRDFDNLPRQLGELRILRTSLGFGLG